MSLAVAVQKNLLLGWRSPAAPVDNSFERLSLSRFRMLTRWYRFGSSSCSLHNKLHNMLTVLQLRLAFLRGHVVSFSEVHGLQKSASFAASFCSTFEIILQYFSEVMLRCCKLFERIIACAVVSFRVLSFLLRTPAEFLHICKGTFLLHCLLSTFRTASSRRLTTSAGKSVFSLFSAQLRCVYSLPYLFT